MSAFYFLTRDGDGDFVNDEPYDYPDLFSALDAAKEAITEMAADGIPLQDGGVISIEIQNERRATIVNLRLQFSVDFLEPDTI